MDLAADSAHVHTFPVLIPDELVLYILRFVVPRKKYKVQPSYRTRKSGAIARKPKPCASNDNRPVSNASLVCRAWHSFVIELLPASFIVGSLIPRAAIENWHVVTAEVLINYRWKIRRAEKELGTEPVRALLSNVLLDAARNDNTVISKLLLKECRLYFRGSIYSTEYQTACRNGRITTRTKNENDQQKQKPEKRWRKEPKSREKISFNPHVQHALGVVKQRDKESSDRIKLKMTVPHKKPSICNYKNVQRALKEDPDAIVAYKVQGCHRRRCGPHCFYLPMTRREFAEAARQSRAKKRLLEDRRLAMEKRRERQGVPGGSECRLPSSQQAQIARQKKRAKEEARKRAEAMARGYW